MTNKPAGIDSDREDLGLKDDSPALESRLMHDRKTHGEVAVLSSGGIDSAVLCVDLLRRFDRVDPIYVRFGLRWEPAELASLRTFLRRVDRPGLSPLTVIDEPVAGIYEDHWSLGKVAVPGYDSADEEVYLPGRTLLLVAKASIWCRVRGIETLALGVLASNPFPDSTPEFYRALEFVLNAGFEGRIRLIRPFEGASKTDVLRLGSGLPLGLTLSCLSPVGGRHCGDCNKCAERRRAFRTAGIEDSTAYVGAIPPIEGMECIA
jgi:7-cyano-7-deazaguanine synthase